MVIPRNEGVFPKGARLLVFSLDFGITYPPRKLPSWERGWIPLPLTLLTTKFRP